MHSISAAHTTLPLPSYVRVTNLNNGRSIVVRVNDRGPYHRDRVIDLSIGTAKALDFYHRGIARVRVEYVGRAPIEGSDDTMLMATLREDAPAPAPSKVMVAAAKPFIPKPDDEAKAPLHPERSYALASTSSRPAKPVSLSDIASADRAKTKPAPRPAYASAAPPRAAVAAAGQRSRALAHVPVRICADAPGGRQRARPDERPRALLAAWQRRIPRQNRVIWGWSMLLGAIKAPRMALIPALRPC